MLRHEIPFRGKEAMDKVGSFKLTVCGAGAIGSNLVLNLSKQGFKDFLVVDFDRVEEHNIGTQTYGPRDVGRTKVSALRDIVFNASFVDIKTEPKKLEKPGKLRTPDLFIDAFDNSESRALITQYCKDKGIACLHAGFNGAFAEVKWNENYVVPSNAGEDICEYPLARNLVTFTCSVLAEAVILYATSGQKLNAEITFKDLHIHTF